MNLCLEEKTYPVEIERKSSNKNTYIRVKKDLTILVTTNYFTKEKAIVNLLEENRTKIKSMIEIQEKKCENNAGFFYLGKKYEIVYVDYCDISLGEERVFMNKTLNQDAWYKKQAQQIFKEHLDTVYNSFTRKIPYPGLRIRKMTTRWGVCNVRTKIITLNLELIKRDVKYLDYVIVHELSHLIHANHSKEFWSVVEENMPDYKKYRKEMKEF